MTTLTASQLLSRAVTLGELAEKYEALGDCNFAAVLTRRQEAELKAEALRMRVREEAFAILDGAT